MNDVLKPILAKHNKVFWNIKKDNKNLFLVLSPNNSPKQ